MLILKLAGCSGYIDGLMDPLLEFRKFQWPVVIGGRQAEPALHQTLFSGPVPVIHGTDLGQGHMALVHKQDEILREIVQQSMGWRPGGAPLNDPGVVLDTGAVAQFLDHLDVIHGALLDALGLDQLVLIRKIRHPGFHFLVNFLNGGVHLVLGRHIMGGRPDGNVVQAADGRTCHGVDL